MNRNIYYSEIDSPIGVLTLRANARGLTGVYMAEHRHSPAARDGWIRDDPALADAHTQLDEYFAGARVTFDLPVDFAGAGTEFQQEVWRALCEIPHAMTISYGELARRIGRPAAVRAVGLANGRNPVSIIVPCHRVIGANGTLTGYGGGLERKRWLLDHEQRRRAASEARQEQPGEPPLPLATNRGRPHVSLAPPCPNSPKSNTPANSGTSASAIASPRS